MRDTSATPKMRLPQPKLLATCNLAFSTVLNVLLAVLLPGCFFPSAFAQTETATIAGRVNDSSGAVVPGATLRLVNIDKGTETDSKTNGSGIYAIPGVTPGRYRIQVEHDGFKVANLTGLTVNVQDNLEENFRLEVGSVSESVTVNGEGLQMNTTDGSVSTVINRQFIANIPLNGRSFQDLISLTPGVVTQSPQVSQVAGESGDFSVNGQRAESNSYMVDGISGNTNPGTGNASVGASLGGNVGAATALGTTQSLVSVDALQEFRVESSTYSAEYGRSPGGQFSFVSRSGTSTLHGSLFDYFRNNYFDANNWFNDYFGVAQPALRQNDFGSTVGGPIRIPGLYKGTHETFFFMSYEGLRLTQPTEASLQYVPSNSLRAAAPSPVQPILNAFPTPTGPEIQIECDDVTFQCPTGQPVGTIVPSGLAPWTQAYSLPSTINSTSLRLDHAFNPRTHAFLRAAYTTSTSGQGYTPSLVTVISNIQTYTGGIDTQLSDSLNDELRVGYARSIAKAPATLTNFGGGAPINLSQALGNNVSPAAENDFSVQFTGIGETDLITQAPANYNQQWNVANSVGESFGHHTVKAGVSYLRIASPVAFNDPSVDPVYQSPASIVNNSADYIYIARELSPKPLYNQFSLFAQDEWRITPTLNFSIGLRWEVDPAPQSANANKPFPLRGDPDDPSTYTLGTQGAQLYSTTWGNVAPRIGAAWKVRRNSGKETILRGGVGIFYDTGTSATGQAFQSVGTSVHAEPISAPLPISPAQLDLPFVVSPPYQTVYAASPTFQLPYTIQWNASLEQAIGRVQNITLSYVAANGRRLVKENVLNVGPQNPDFTYLVLYENGLTSNYQSLQVQFQRQVSHGFQALLSYTWSHSLDSGSADGGLGYIRGNSDFDLRNNFNAALTWDWRVNRGDAFSQALLNGWGADARITVRSAFPVNLTGNPFFDSITGSEQYAGVDIVPGMPFYSHSPLLPGGREINSDAFESAPPNTLGDAPRNFLRGFGESQVNLAVRREFPLSERLRLQFRAEAFNAFNHPNFGFIDPRLSDATFGQATNTLAQALATVSPLYQQGGARSMQFALKLIF